MDPSDFAVIRALLARIQEPDVSRRDRDAARRQVLRWLQGRGLTLREEEGAFAIGHTDVEGEYERFHPEWLVGPDGSVESAAEPEDEEDDEEEGEETPPMPEPEKAALRANVQTLVDKLRGDATEREALLGLLAMFDQPTLRDARWHDVQEIMAPLIARLDESEPGTLVDLLLEHSPRSGAVPHLLGSLWGRVKDRPDWRLPEALVPFLEECRYWSEKDPEGAGTWSAQLYARSPVPVDDALRRFALKRGAPSDDVLWVMDVLDGLPKTRARSLRRELIEAFRARPDYERVEMVASGLEISDDLEEGRWLADVVAEGVGRGHDMLESWSELWQSRRRNRPELWEEELRRAGVDAEKLQMRCGWIGSDGSPRVHRRTGELWYPPFKFEREEDAPAPRPPGPAEEWLELPNVTADELRRELTDYAATLPSPLADRVRDALKGMFFLRSASNELLGHPAEWVQFQEIRHELEWKRYAEAARRVLATRAAATTPTA